MEQRWFMTRFSLRPLIHSPMKLSDQTVAAFARTRAAQTRVLANAATIWMKYTQGNARAPPRPAENQSDRLPVQSICRLVANLLDGSGVPPPMNTNHLDTKFARIGARLKVIDRPSRRSRASGVVSLDVQADRKGEFFEIFCQPQTEAEITVLDVQPGDRHLLLLVREGKEKSKFLCGHDERHWFVAGIPEA